MSMKQQFKTPLECAEHHEKHMHEESYSAFFERCKQNSRKGKLQLPCGKCGRFMWPEDRCNLFE